MACNAYSPLTEVVNHLYPSRDCSVWAGDKQCLNAQRGRRNRLPPFILRCPPNLKGEPGLELDTAVVGHRAASRSATRAAAETGVHAGGQAELQRVQVADVARRI